MASIGLIVGSASSPSSSRDIPIRDLLVANGHTVTYVDDSVLPMPWVYDILIISESSSTSNAEGWHAVNLPIITTEVLIAGEGYGSGSSSGAGDETGKVNLAHYITNGYAVNDEFEYVDSGDDRGYVTGWSNDVEALLVVANNTARAIILAIEDGDTDANGDTVIKRRVMFTHPRAGEWTSAGETIFLRCVDWCLGLDAGGTNYTENLSGAIAGSGQITAPVAMAESFSESIQNAGVLTSTAQRIENLSGATASNASLSAAGQMIEHLTAVFTSSGSSADGFLILENLSGLTANAGTISATAQFAEAVSGAASAAGQLGAAQQMQESIANASKLTGTIAAGIQYLESLSASTANAGLIADLRGFYENLLSQTASSGSLSAFAGLVENLQGLTASAFNIAASQQGTEILSGVINTLGQITDALQNVQAPSSRQTFYRKYNLSFIYPEKLRLCWDRKRSFAA